MPLTPAIINPVKGANPPKLGHIALIVAAEADLGFIVRKNEKIVRYKRKLYLSNMYQVPTKTSFFTLVGPILGAPYAAMVAEALFVWGIEKIVFLGWCGSISQAVSAGELVVPEAAIIDEGTSPNYTDRQDLPAFADSRMLTIIKSELKMRDQYFHSGPIWSTDAVYRETVEKVRHFRAKGALGVEMETAAIFSVARFRTKAAGAVLIVSDELSALTWNPGFKKPEFKRIRQKIYPIALELCSDLADQ
jgi:purine-nucleoside phosphorylase